MIQNHPSEWRTTPDYSEITPASIKAGAWKPSPVLEWSLIVIGAIEGLAIIGLVGWLIIYAIKYA